MTTWRAVTIRGERSRFVPWILTLLLIFTGLVSLACVSSVGRVPGVGTGSYPIDIFAEMHYQQSYKSQEPPRLLPPEGSVPRTFRKSGSNGATLFATNCAMCHGAHGKGDGEVLKRMEAKYGYVPAITPDLTSPAVQNLPNVALLGFIQGGVVVMPSFKNLLTIDEQMLIVDHLRTLRQ